RAAFTTRMGGVGKPPAEGLDLGYREGTPPAAVRENRRLLAGALGIEPGQVLSARQVHGAELEIHNGPRPSAAAGGQSAAADGQVSRSAAAIPMVLVADCLPVALYGPGSDADDALATNVPGGVDARATVAMLHCGWRGLAAGIVAEGVAATGATRAAIGPGIGACCFEVGDEVRERFADLAGRPGPDGSHTPLKRGRHLDLPEVAERLLRRAGVESIERAGICTSCSPSLFYSYRRDGADTGRQAGLAWLERWSRG
ncbi:MAG TPA: polyphenol oxidase family protein, partial [Solirubrobacterales bacterium]|nr:polyphenol oxidase family protein [Solirubrobacterales bacterium]